MRLLNHFLLVLLLAVLLPGSARSQGWPLPIPGPPAGGGSLTGRVEDSNGRPVADARVKLDNGRGDWTDGGGRFHFEGLAPGRYKVTITRSGYRTGQGAVTITEGATRNLLVTLSPDGSGPVPGPSPTVRTTLTIVAYRYHSGDKRYRVKQIEVWDTDKQWQNSYWRTYDSKVELRCDGAVVGRRYKVAITWRSRDGSELRGMWEPQVWKQDQREVYYNP